MPDRPNVRLDGVEVRILVAGPAEYNRYVNGPIKVKIKTPKSVTRELVMTDARFNGHGETVTATTETIRGTGYGAGVGPGRAWDGA